MGFLGKIESGWKELLTSNEQTVNLSNNNTNGEQKKRVLDYTIKAMDVIRKDIKSWKQALAATTFTDDPIYWKLQQIYDRIGLDALLSSQIENRINQCLSASFSILKSNGEIDEAQTLFIRNTPTYRKITQLILESIYFGYSLGEINLQKLPTGEYWADINSIPRTNIVPTRGRFYNDFTDVTKFIEYRNINEYGTYILEFNRNDYGLLNKACPHVLMKSFTQSCWSELCEIYGIPPRVLKTNTQDTQMLNRAKKMMEDTGVITGFIVDQMEEFSFATGVATNGDVYSNLINLCNNEISMLISGAIIGQDTKNGSNSKEQTSQSKLDSLVQSDLKYVSEQWNTLVIPALKKLGVIKGDVHLHFDPVEDLAELWSRTKDSFPYMEVDPEFVKTKFGVEVLGSKQATTQKLSIGPDFFV